MRKQYHSKRTDKGRYIWDVHNLVELSKDFPVKEVPLTSISEIEQNYWYDCPNGPKPILRDIAIHAKLINEADLSYPIILSQDGGIMDGAHRVCKALIEKRDTIKAVQFDKNPKPDYIDVDIGSLPHDKPVNF
jgi:hypothetical protein